jgi:hypothetical protein
VIEELEETSLPSLLTSAPNYRSTQHALPINVCTIVLTSFHFPSSIIIISFLIVARSDLGDATALMILLSSIDLLLQSFVAHKEKYLVYLILLLQFSIAFLILPHLYLELLQLSCKFPLSVLVVSSSTIFIFSLF